MEKEWYEADNAGDYDSPALFIYPARIKNNIRSLLEKVKADNLRPHVKTSKIAEVCQLMLDAGIYKFKAATIAEAEMLAGIRAPDVLLAYPPAIPKIKRLIQLVKNYPGTSFSCLVDNRSGAENISRLFDAEKLEAYVYIDLNVGMNRTGILPEETEKLYLEISSLPAIRIRGLHAYDGHIRDQDKEMRKSKCLQAFGPILELQKQLEKLTGYPMILIAGGTPTCFIHAEAGGRECSPGTFIFWDKGYADQLPEQPFKWAAVLFSRVISIPASDLICTDLGYKSVTAENPQPRVYFLNAPEAVPASHSEEHLVLSVADSSLYKTGDILYGIPRHICPSVALYEKAFIVEENHLAGSWKVIARNREINY